MSKICFITAIYGSYEASCKRPVEQTVAADFICFTDNPTIMILHPITIHIQVH